MWRNRNVESHKNNVHILMYEDDFKIWINNKISDQVNFDKNIKSQQ